MKNFFKLLFKRFIIIFIVALAAAVFYFGYPYLFSRVITGEITGAKHVIDSMSVISTTNSKAQIPSSVFSFAVAVRDMRTGEIVTGSSEDRQWAAVKEGQCAKAEFFPYPPWQLSKAGTYFGVRLLSLYDNCKVLSEQK